MVQATDGGKGVPRRALGVASYELVATAVVRPVRPTNLFIYSEDLAAAAAPPSNGHSGRAFARITKSFTIHTAVLTFVEIITKLAF